MEKDNLRKRLEAVVPPPVPRIHVQSVCVPKIQLSADSWRSYILEMAASYRRKGLIND